MRASQCVLVNGPRRVSALAALDSRGRSIRPVLCWVATLLVAWLLVLSGVVRGDIIYVDSRRGDDQNDGQRADPEGASGPVRSLQRAIGLAQRGDEIQLANNGDPYYGGVTLFGERHSGWTHVPFVIAGNGAVLSGAKPVPAGAWQSTAEGYWRVTPWRKTWFQLVRRGEAVPEAECPRDAAALPEIPEGQWCAWRGAVYYRAPLGENPNQQDFALADDEVGLTLLDVHDVLIRELELRHFRLDGINAHDRCREVLLDRVTSRQNGRAGVAVAGTSRVLMLETQLQENRAHSLLLSELGSAELERCRLDQPPTTGSPPSN